MKYAIGLPTRDRLDVLFGCIRAFEMQTIKPSFIVIIDNNSAKNQINISSSYFPIFMLQNKFNVPGPEQAHQTCLEEFVNRGIEVAVRWDDDLYPKPECMSHMLKHFEHSDFEGLVGGCYPRPEKEIWENGYQPREIPPDGNRTHIQFFEWGRRFNKTPIHVPTLYSGIMYRVDIVCKRGGFCTEYSQLGYRGESDLSLRVGDCWIEPKAVAVHHCAKGGVRTISFLERKRMENSDHVLFVSRMKSLKIKPEIL